PSLARSVLDVVTTWPATPVDPDEPGLPVVSLALPGLERTASRLLAVPDCPACGAWRPRAAARAISDGALSAVVTDAQVGLVGSVRPISDEGPPGLAVVQAQVPVQPHTGGWRSDLQGAMGIASTADEARAVAVFEALERYCCVPRGRRLDCASAE